MELVVKGYPEFKEKEGKYETTINEEYIAVRCDMEGFSKFRKSLSKANRIILEEAMIEVCNRIYSKFPCICVFSFSDEVNVIITPYLEFGRLQKIISKIASFASVVFTTFINQKGISGTHIFDGRIATTGSLKEVRNYIALRESMVLAHGYIKASGINIDPVYMAVDTLNALKVDLAIQHRYSELSHFSKIGFLIATLSWVNGSDTIDRSEYCGFTKSVESLMSKLGFSISPKEAYIYGCYAPESSSQSKEDTEFSNKGEYSEAPRNKSIYDQEVDTQESSNKQEVDTQESSNEQEVDTQESYDEQEVMKEV